MGNTPKSIIIIWFITAIAVLLSIISLIGIIISRSDKIKKRVLLDFQKKGIYIQDFSLRIFPVSDDFSLYLKGLKLNEISFDSLSISFGKISANGLSFRSISCGTCDLSIGINSSLNIKDLKIQIISKGSGKIDITPICKIKEANKKKISKILSPLSLTLNIYNSSIKIDNVEIALNELSSDIYIDYIEIYSEYTVMIGDKIPKIPGIIDLWLDLEYLDGTADIRIYEPLNTSGKVDLIFCNEKQQMVANYNLSSQPNIKSIFEKASAEPNLITSGSLSILSDGEIISSSNIKGYAKDINVSDQKIGNIDMDISIDYSKDEIGFLAKLRSNYINMLVGQGKYNIKDKNLNLKFSGDFDLDKLPELDLSGKLFANGYLNLPKLKLESDIVLNSFAYDTIRVDQSYGKLNISPKTIKFDLDIKHQKSDLHWTGEFDIKKQNLESQARFFHSSLNGLLKILNIDLPIDGNSDGEILVNILKNKLSVLGNFISYGNSAFGEKIQCIYVDVVGDVDIRNGNFSVSVKGMGSERNSFCANRIIEPYDNSLIYFETNVDSKKFSVSISGIYDLSNFDMLKLSMRGNAYFNGNISGYTSGKPRVNGEIDLISEKVEITDYAIASSCVNGKILISDESVQFQGKICEGFDLYSLYYFKDSKFSLYASKGETAFSIQENNITGKGRLEDVSMIIPRIKDNIGNFEMKYNLEKKDGSVYVLSPTFSLGDLKFENLDFFGDIRNNTMQFSVSGFYSGEKFSGKGEYDISSRKIISDFELKNFARIPLIGKLTVSGTIDKPYISGNFKVKDVEISDENIKDIANKSGSQAENEKESGTLNIKVEIQNVEYRAPFINLKINGLLYIMGTTEEPVVFGMLDITDGNFSLADTEFSGIKGTAFVRGENIFLNISGSTDISTFEGEKFKIQIRIVGDIRSPKVYLSSIPSITQSDIVCIIATYRKCDSLDEFNKIIASVIYRNFSLISHRILGDIGESTKVRIIISPTDIGFARKFGYFDILVMQSLTSDIKTFSASRNFGENYQLIFSWDNKRYGYSILGDIGNIGFDLKRHLRF